MIKNRTLGHSFYSDEPYQKLEVLKYSEYLVPLYHSHKERKDSLEPRAELAVLCTYVENQVILEPILVYRTSKCKQTKEHGSEDYLWTHIFNFL